MMDTLHLELGRTQLAFEETAKRRKLNECNGTLLESDTSLVDDLQALLACVADAAANPDPNFISAGKDTASSAACSSAVCTAPREPLAVDSDEDASPHDASKSSAPSIYTDTPGATEGLFVSLSLHQVEKGKNSLVQVSKFYCDTSHIIKIGRGPNNDVKVNIGSISWFHAELFVLPPQYDKNCGHLQLAIRDVSSNGTGVSTPGSAWQRLVKGEDTVVSDGALLVLPWKKNDKGGQLYYTVNITPYGATSAALAVERRNSCLNSSTADIASNYGTPSEAACEKRRVQTQLTKTELDISEGDDLTEHSIYVNVPNTRVVNHLKSEVTGSDCELVGGADEFGDAERATADVEVYHAEIPRGRQADELSWELDTYLDENNGVRKGCVDDFVGLMPHCSSSDMRVKFLDAVERSENRGELVNAASVASMATWMVNWMERALEEGSSESESVLLKAFDVLEALPPPAEHDQALQDRLRHVCAEIQEQYPDLCAQELLQRWDVDVGSNEADLPGLSEPDISDASPFIGTWLHSKGGRIVITEIGNTLYITNPIAGPAQVPARDFLSGGYMSIKGTVSADGSSISWSNGSTWFRQAHIDEPSAENMQTREQDPLLVESRGHAKVVPTKKGDRRCPRDEEYAQLRMSVTRFILTNRISDSVGEILRREPYHVQQTVLDEGRIEVHSQRAEYTVMNRIRQARHLPRPQVATSADEVGSAQAERPEKAAVDRSAVEAEHEEVEKAACPSGQAQLAISMLRPKAPPEQPPKLNQEALRVKCATQSVQAPPSPAFELAPPPGASPSQAKMQHPPNELAPTNGSTIGHLLSTPPVAMPSLPAPLPVPPLIQPSFAASPLLSPPFAAPNGMPTLPSTLPPVMPLQPLVSPLAPVPSLAPPLPMPFDPPVNSNQTVAPTAMPPVDMFVAPAALLPVPASNCIAKAPVLPPWRRPGSWLHAKMQVDLEASNLESNDPGLAQQSLDHQASAPMELETDTTPVPCNVPPDEEQMASPDPGPLEAEGAALPVPTWEDTWESSGDVWEVDPATQCAEGASAMASEEDEAEFEIVDTEDEFSEVD